MTNEYKQLLLTDLCARLPYCVKVWYKYYPINITEKFATSIKLSDNKIALSSKFTKEFSWHAIEEAGEILIKPYLRPMSSMTEEDKKVVCSMNTISDTELNERLNYQKMYVQNYTIETFDYFNEHHFDFRGLIEK